MRPGTGSRKQAPCQKNKQPNHFIRCTLQAKYLKRNPRFWGVQLITILLCIAENRFSFPSVCTTGTKLQVLPLSVTSVLVPLQEPMKQHTVYLLLHVLPTAILFEVTIFPNTDSAPQEKETKLWPLQQTACYPPCPPIKSRASLASLHPAYPINLPHNNMMLWFVSLECFIKYL